MDTHKRVEELCRELGTTPSAVAKKAGLNHSTFSTSKRRSGQLKIDTIELFCEAIGIPLWFFFFESQGHKADRHITLKREI